MNRKKLLQHLVFLMFFIFITDLLAKGFYWYYSISWFDMLMHFLGGFWVGLFFLYVFYDKNQFSKKLLAVILGVLLIGVLWEVFEFFLNVIAHDTFSIADTLSDIFFDLVGGFLAIFFYFKKIMPVASNTV